MIAFLGTGLMGAGFVRAFLARGENVTVWNRTSSKAEALAADGARVADSPADAVRGARRVHLSLLDDRAVDDVLARLLPALEPGAIIVDHSTTAPQPTAARAARLAAAGVPFLHAPVFMGPGNAREGTGLMLVAGPQPLFEEMRPELDRMTGTVRYMGERSDLAAAFKLFGNMMIMFVISGLADLYALARGLGIDPREAYTLFRDFNPSGQVTGRGKRMAEGDYVPAMFELAAARKDIRLMLESADASGATLHVLPAIAARFDEFIAAGFGGDDLGVVANPEVR
jgi:3-hydroxyisobutyrate dehydrogenase-like beta-hydroxyacid dehydrogenase